MPLSDFYGLGGGASTLTTLTDVVAITPIADSMFYFTGSTSIARADLSSFARTILDDADAGAARTTLGLGTAATQNTGTSGANVPLLNAANTFGNSVTQTFNNTVAVTNGTTTANLEITTPSGYGASLRLNSNLSVGTNYLLTTQDSVFGRMFIERNAADGLFLREADASSSSTAITFQRRSSTTANQNIAKINHAWIVSTHASRTGKLELQVADATSYRVCGTLWTDGSRGYFAMSAPNGTAPDSNQPNNTVCFYRDGSNNLQVRYKNNSGTTTDINLGAVT